MEEKQKKELAKKLIDRLKKEYPDAGCTLDYDDAWKLLVSVRLAAQCTDARVNVVVEKLYEKFPDVAALASAKAEEIEEIVRPCGLGKSKARDISAYPLHPSGEPHGTGGRNQRTGKSGKGAVETDTAGGGQ